MKLLFIVLCVALVSIFVSCSKGSAGTNTNAAPANLIITATPASDSSGNVAFVATATNATTFEFNFGNGVAQIVPSGKITYKYAASGTYQVTVTAKNAGSQTISKSISATVYMPLKLVWSDEFNTDGAPDSTKWGYDLGAGNGWGNNELEYYTNRPDNVIVSNGTLKIIARKENYQGSSYTSARILTKDKYAVTYGKVEVRAKLPENVGTWPAIWMLGDDIATTGWPGCGEIDIMEHRGSELNKIFGTLHYPNHSGANGNGSTTMISNAATEFHIYSLDWTAQSIQIAVDGNVFQTVANSTAIPFNHNFFFILNVAMGGNFGGAVTPTFTKDSMEVDYIRVYQ